MHKASTMNNVQLSLLNTNPLYCSRLYLISKIRLLQNGYPRGNVNDVLNKHKGRHAEPTLTVPKKDVVLVLPYLGLHSDVITRRLKTFMALSTSRLFFRTLAELTLSFLTKIVSAARRNRTLFAKPCQPQGYFSEHSQN